VRQQAPEQRQREGHAQPEEPEVVRRLGGEQEEEALEDGVEQGRTIPKRAPSG
jgi:hypothetical protein